MTHSCMHACIHAFIYLFIYLIFYRILRPRLGGSAAFPIIKTTQTPVWWLLLLLLFYTNCCGCCSCCCCCCSSSSSSLFIPTRPILQPWIIIHSFKYDVFSFKGGVVVVVVLLLLLLLVMMMIVMMMIFDNQLDQAGQIIHVDPVTRLGERVQGELGRGIGVELL